MRIMVVEDDPFIALEIEDALQSAGHHVVGLAASLPAALRLAAREEPELALVDVFLGREPDGLQVAAELIRRGVHVVFVTGSAELIPPDYAGAIGLIPKPFSADGVLDAVAFVIAAAVHGAPPPEIPRCLRLSPSILPDVDGRFWLQHS